jgi:hypothetical protein
MREPHVNSVVTKALHSCFPTLPRDKFQIATFALASVVYHSEFLKTHLPPEHPVFRTVLFRENKIMQSLKPFVKCCMPDADSEIQATGVPPYTSILMDIKDLRDKLKDNLKIQEENVEKMVLFLDILGTSILYTCYRSMESSTSLKNAP